jgi:hypothetical protein
MFFSNDIFTLVRQLRYGFIRMVQENNRSELQRLDRERKEDILVMLKGFVTSQVLCRALYPIIFCDDAFVEKKC